MVFGTFFCENPVSDSQGVEVDIHEEVEAGLVLMNANNWPKWALCEAA